MVAEMAHIFLADAEGVPFEECRQADYLTMLVLRARSGDALAFERIMMATERRVVSIAWRMLGNQDDARDAAQEVYLRVFKYLSRFRVGEDFRAWLYRITINVCRDFARKRAVARDDELNLSDESHWIELPHPGDDPERQALQSQQRRLILRALRTLSEKERAALVLRDLEGLSTDEVARVLGSRAVTIRSRISSARAKIKIYCERFSRQKGFMK